MSAKDSYSPAPDIGELLVKRGILEPKDIELAIHYQNRQAAQGHHQTLEQTLVWLGLVDRYTLDQLLADDVRNNHASVDEESGRIETRVHTQIQQTQNQLKFLQSAVGINQQLQRAPNLSEVTREATKLVVQDYEIDFASIFLWEELSQTLRLSHSSSSSGEEILHKTLTIAPDSQSCVGWVGKYHQVCINDSLKSTSVASFVFPNTKSEASLPITNGDAFIGVLDVQSSQDDAFDEYIIDALLIVCNFLGQLVHHFQSQETATGILGELSILYQANQGFAHTLSREQVIRHCYKTLRQLPQTIYLLSVEGDKLQLVSAPDSPYSDELTSIIQPLLQLPLETLSDQFIFHEYLQLTEYIASLGIPEEYLETLTRLGYHSLTLFPIKNNQQLEALMFLCIDDSTQIEQNGLQLCQSLAIMASAALEKIANQSTIEKQLNRLHILENVSQVITVELEMDNLFNAIHQQISNVMGDVGFNIALYDQEHGTIEIPFAYEEGQVISIPSFPIGEGLTSIIIRNRQPLLLVEDTENRAKQLGAKVYGAPAKSWLGVPLMVCGEVIGALIVQDLEKEHRFDLEDQQLLSMIASQVGVAVRNSRLIYDTTRRAERESIVAEITNKLWSASGVDTILRTALGELGRELNADSGLISLEMSKQG